MSLAVVSLKVVLERRVSEVRGHEGHAVTQEVMVKVLELPYLSFPRLPPEHIVYMERRRLELTFLVAV